MRIPLGWLKEFVDFTLAPDSLAATLTMIGLEVEGVEMMKDEPVFEVNVTPNRPDCLSVLGIAREVSAIVGIPLRFPDHRIAEEGAESSIRVEISDQDLCHRYAGREITDVAIGESPEWLKKRLEQCGMRPINNVVDITNYVLLEMGHPLHAFDRETLRGRMIRVGRSSPGSAMKTLDGSPRELPEDSLLIWDSERPVAVAGIMGGAETEVTGGTSHVFLESAYFLPPSIRRTSKRLGLKTESSYRFERGTDIETLARALDRASFLISKIAGGTVSKKVDVYPKPFIAPQIEVRYGRVNKVLGLSIAQDAMIDIVERLGFVVAKNEASFIATPPSFRTDVQKEIDLIEEIARFYGYDRIPVTVPRTPIAKEAADGIYSSIPAVRDSMRGAGFTEAINYSFMNPRILDTLGIAENDVRRKTLVLMNPIKTEESHLRTFLVPSLLENLRFNLSLGNRDVRLFEISRVFRDKGESLPGETHHLGALYCREKTPMLWKDETPPFFIVKGSVEALLEMLRVQDFTFESSSEPFLHPGKSCDILLSGHLSGKKAGFLGVLHPLLVENLDLKISRAEVVLFEIDLDVLLRSVSGKAAYTPIPRYPHIDRDVALLVDRSLTAASLLGLMKAHPSELIEEVSLFDCYTGKGIPEGKKSLAFAIRYRAKDRTLTDSEIEELHSSLVNYVVEKTGGSVRGG